VTGRISSPRVCKEAGLSDGTNPEQPVPAACNVSRDPSTACRGPRPDGRFGSEPQDVSPSIDVNRSALAISEGRIQSGWFKSQYISW
jgi:hypothetical protein